MRDLDFLKDILYRLDVSQCLLFILRKDLGVNGG